MVRLSDLASASRDAWPTRTVLTGEVRERLLAFDVDCAVRRRVDRGAGGACDLVLHGLGRAQTVVGDSCDIVGVDAEGVRVDIGA